MAKLTISKRTRSIVLGLIFGLLCALCVGAYITHLDEQAHAAQAEMLAKYGGEQIDVCVARRDIAAGATITDGDVETKTWIAALLPAQAVIDKKDAVGKRVGSTILAGEVVSESRFGFESSDIEVPDGLVAVSVPSREVQAVGGAVRAGMTTDVYAVGGSSTTRIASGVQVLATSGSSGGGSAGAWVTLAVEPAVVQELVTAAETLEIYFTLPAGETQGAGGAEANGAGVEAGAAVAGGAEATRPKAGAVTGDDGGRGDVIGNQATSAVEGA